MTGVKIRSRVSLAGPETAPLADSAARRRGSGSRNLPHANGVGPVDLSAISVEQDFRRAVPAFVHDADSGIVPLGNRLDPHLAFEDRVGVIRYHIDRPSAPRCDCPQSRMMTSVAHLNANAPVTKPISVSVFLRPLKCGPRSLMAASVSTVRVKPARVLECDKSKRVFWCARRGWRNMIPPRAAAARSRTA
jgi:hypothetical protein